MVFQNSFFCQKVPHFLHFGPYDLIEISSPCSPITCQIMYGEILDFWCQHLQRQHVRVLMANLLQKLISGRVFYVAITESHIGSLKSLRALFDKYLDHTLVKFEQNRIVGNIHKFSYSQRKGTIKWGYSSFYWQEVLIHLVFLKSSRVGVDVICSISGRV